mmetsp:Transcript_36947/g.95722  ORF Transcript_36947/g.95722 Transcript_36947/m.95722 type:complete len:269 (+) Transcript_36947:494-1300(+)
MSGLADPGKGLPTLTLPRALCGVMHVAAAPRQEPFRGDVAVEPSGEPAPLPRAEYGAGVVDCGRGQGAPPATAPPCVSEAPPPLLLPLALYGFGVVDCCARQGEAFRGVVATPEMETLPVQSGVAALPLALYWSRRWSGEVFGLATPALILLACAFRVWSQRGVPAPEPGAWPPIGETRGVRAPAEAASGPAPEGMGVSKPQVSVRMPAASMSPPNGALGVPACAVEEVALTLPSMPPAMPPAPEPPPPPPPARSSCSRTRRLRSSNR